ncbi:MAG: hypothetical protein FAZ92_02435 [Accumulibacter sp.]|nr:MAG: hypothetical protein FAZ92_02435 [Accumulibacter sp.]
MLAPPPQHRDLARDRTGQRGQGALGAAFLDEANHRVDHGDAKNHGRVNPFTEDGSHHAGQYQHQHQRLHELQREPQYRSAARGGRQPVLAVLRAAAGRFCVVEPLFEAGRQARGRFLCRQRVPGDILQQ